jgi:hypothetical protein
MILHDINTSHSHQMNRTILILLLLIFSCPLINSQESREEQAPPIRERLFFGGNLGLQFGTITDIQVAPVVGLWVLPRIAVAVGPDYRYYHDPISATNVYGAKAYVELTALRNINSFIPIGQNTSIVFHLEDELLSLESSFWKGDPYLTNRFYLNTILAGGGLSQQLGRKSFLDVLFLWPLNESQYGVYSSPEIRISFYF